MPSLFKFADIFSQICYQNSESHDQNHHLAIYRGLSVNQFSENVEPAVLASTNIF